MLKKLTAAVTLAAAACGAMAVPTIDTGVDGVHTFGGFDWASNASVWIRDYNIVSGGAGRTGQQDVFTLNYQAYAVNVQDENGANIAGLTNMKTTDVLGGYEYTINATITEVVTCLNSNCSLVQIDVISGTWDVYFDTTGDAVLGGAGITGILDGTKILSGTFSAGQPIVGSQGPSNPGNVALLGAFTGAVTMTDNAYINPDLSGTEAVSTLQFGSRTTAWTRPGNFDGIGSTGADSNTDFVGQADANQTFVPVPEPASLGLVGLALLGLGAARRRRSA